MFPVTDNVLAPAIPLACVILVEPVKAPTLRLVLAMSSWPLVIVSVPVLVNAAVKVTPAALLIVISEVVGIPLPVNCAAVPLYTISDPEVYVLVPVSLILPVPAVVEIPAVEATFIIAVELTERSVLFVPPPSATIPALPILRVPLTDNAALVPVL